MDIESLYRMYFQDVFLYLRSLSGDADTAEELTQEVFFKALRAIGSFDGTKDILAWLFTIAKNAYFTDCRRRKRQVQQDFSVETEDPRACFTEHFENEERAFQIHRFLHEMKEPYKEVFSLRVFGELSFEKIGQLFGKSSGWARVTYHRARKQIIEYMEEMENG